MGRTPYTHEEVILCAYAALFEGDDIGGIDAIHSLQRRSLGSIKMKIQKIAAMLDEADIPRSSDVKPLTGKPPGEGGRRTNWDIVAYLATLPRAELLARCERIVERS